MLRTMKYPNPPPHAAFCLLGGETEANARVEYLCNKALLKSYKSTRNGMVGTDYSTKLSAHLAMGCISARTINEAISEWERANGGECEGTKGIRFELLWRDYMVYTVSIGHC